MRDEKTGLELRNKDIPEVLEELGSPVFLIKESYIETDNPTQDNRITTEYETNGVVFTHKDYYGNVLSATGEREIIIDVSMLGEVIPEISDSIKDGDTVYKIVDVELYKYAGITVAASLKAVM